MPRRAFSLAAGAVLLGSKLFKAFIGALFVAKVPAPSIQAGKVGSISSQSSGSA
jgi:hypothetical protein